jgi:hypothetical protein
MQLTVFNCSPKPGKSNSELLIDSFISGIKRTAECEIESVRLNRVTVDEAVEIFDQAPNILIVMPLYSYAMPGGVMEFFEALEALKGKCEGKRLSFILQYGFMEAVHGRPLEHYFERFCEILGCTYVGTVVKGGCDGLSKNSRKRFIKVYEGMEQIGETFGSTGAFDLEELGAYAAPEVREAKGGFIMKIALFFINQIYWKKMMKSNGVSVRASFARPYEGEMP